MACIFARVVVFPSVKAFTFSLMGWEASIRVLTRFPYQFPMSSQLANSFLFDVPPDGKNDTIICPATPFKGGMSGSGLIPLTSLTAHCNTLPPFSSGFTSACESHEALNTQPAGSCSE